MTESSATKTYTESQVRSTALVSLLIGVVAGGFLGASIAKGGHETAAASSTSAAADALAAAQTAAPPPHNWTSKDGDEYAYASEISEDDRKAGKAVADVVMFKYLGEHDGNYTVQSTQNGVTATAECSNPCQIVKVTSRSPLGVNVQHVTFTEASLVGAALTDAMNGQMEVAGRR